MVLDSDRNQPHSTVDDTDDHVNLSSRIRPPGSSQTSQTQSSALDSDDEEVVPCSPRSFYEAKEKVRKMKYERAMQRSSSGRWLSHNRRYFQRCSSDSSSRSFSEDEKWLRRARGKLEISNNAPCINLEDSDDASKDKTGSSQSAPPPEVPTCPICMQPFVEETATKCGHIFCKECIKKAIASQKKCPVCRKKLTAKSIFRIHLPFSQ